MIYLSNLVWGMGPFKFGYIKILAKNQNSRGNFHYLTLKLFSLLLRKMNYNELTEIPYFGEPTPNITQLSL